MKTTNVVVVADHLYDESTFRAAKRESVVCIARWAEILVWILDGSWPQNNAMTVNVCEFAYAKQALLSVEELVKDGRSKFIDRGEFGVVNGGGAGI